MTEYSTAQFIQCDKCKLYVISAIPLEHKIINHDGLWVKVTKDWCIPCFKEMLRFEP